MIILHIFRRDYRIIDNTSLLNVNNNDKIIPLFIFTPQQVSDENKYKSDFAINFMIKSLENLNDELNDGLWCLYDDEISAIKKVHKETKFNVLQVNEDYTPYSKLRDNRIKKWCNENNVEFKTFTDILLFDDTLKTTAQNGNIYKVFTQFYKNKIKNSTVRKPIKKLDLEFVKRPNKKYKLNNYSKMFYNNDLEIQNYGRENALKILSNLNKFTNYNEIRDYPVYNTTHLSSHNHFGTVSIREIYYMMLKKVPKTDLIKQLIWRDFYYYISSHFPELFQYKHLIKNNPSTLKWNTKYFDEWCNGLTGFPFVDAGMRELNQTGFMHNRSRLITSSFLIKDLLINWKYGERYFTKKLIDIDRCQNTGNWNWSSSYGLDNSVFLRILNPWTQIEKYDPECKYIKKWIPELKNVEIKHIKKWYKYHTLYNNVYIKPIVDHDECRKKFILFYKKYFD